MDVYVVDTGEQEVYVIAANEFEACEKVMLNGDNIPGEPVKYAEWFSNDPADADY
jgi:hypothetical protein